MSVLTFYPPICLEAHETHVALVRRHRQGDDRRRAAGQMDTSAPDRSNASQIRRSGPTGLHVVRLFLHLNVSFRHFQWPLPALPNDGIGSIAPTRG